jgi:CheY-like chemotaxis protein
VDVPTVLIVDDDRDVRDALESAVAIFCCRRVVTAEHGAAALAALRQTRPCLILLDLVMPVMDGWQFLEELRRDAALAGIPVLIVSAHAGSHPPDGVAGFLSKPVDLHDLEDAVTEHCPQQQ